jgi:hypothetical protein
MLEPIQHGNDGEALAILSRGFPSRSREFWQAGLGRQAKYQDTGAAGPLGYLMRVAGAPAGIILTMRSHRPCPDGRPKSVLNLSSWYVDEQHRWLAPRMLQKVLAEDVDIFTDLTPSPPVREMVRRLGFVQRYEGVLLAPLAVSALQFGASATIAPFDDAGARSLPPETVALLADHRALGCMVAFLTTGGRVQPLVFSPTRRKQLPSARLVFAPCVADVRDHIGVIARYLLAQGVMFLEIPANRGETAFGAWFTTRPPPTFARGEVDFAAVDHAYSEFVFLQT